MTDKTCPFHQGFAMGSNHATYVDAKLKRCDGTGCQLWVKLEKDRILVTGRHSRMPDPDAIYIYEGCGLVTAIPWILVNKAKVKKSENQHKHQLCNRNRAYKGHETLAFLQKPVRRRSRRQHHPPKIRNLYICKPWGETMKLTDALEKLHPVVPISPFILDILKEYKLSDLKEIKANKIDKALKEAEKAYQEAHQRTENTTSDYSYWSALGTETVWETVVNLLRSAQKVGADNLPDIPFPDLSDKVVMDAQWYMMKWGAEVANASGVEPVKERK